MASITFYPSYSGQSAVQWADFENGFQVKKINNTYNFNGSWVCPVNPTPEPYTQNIICICPHTGNCAAISVSFSFNNGNAKLNGSMAVSTPAEKFGNSGIADIAQSGGSACIFTSGSVSPDSYISAPYLSGQLGENTF